MNFKIYIAVLSAVMLTLTGYSQTPTVKTRLVADTIMIGDQTLMEVDISKDLSLEVMLPQFQDNKLSDKMEIIGAPRLDTISREGRNITLRISYTITSFEAGVHSFGEFPIVYNSRNVSDTITSPEILSLVVQTFDIDTTKQQIADIKQPMDTPLQWAEIKEIVFYSIAGAILLAIIIYFVIRYIKSRRAKIAARPAEPPHITAIRELERLHSEKLPQSGKYKEYYSRLTDTLRNYIENRFGIQAMEMTTAQIVDAIKGVNDEKLVAKLNELFSTSDLVKFAKWTPTVEDCEEAFNVAYYYVEETKILTTTTVEQDA